MSSDKAPENVYYFKTEKFGFWSTEIKDGEIPEAMYVRQDLIHSDAGYSEYLKERTAYEEQQQTEAEFNVQRRREMFEKVALAFITLGSTPDYEYIGGFVSRLIKEADKFARGEE